VDEIYRMLGREHEANLEREAAKRRRADAVRPDPAAGAVTAKRRTLKRIHPVVARVAWSINGTADVKG
jgi:hypothetical protein